MVTTLHSHSQGPASAANYNTYLFMVHKKNSVILIIMLLVIIWLLLYLNIQYKTICKMALALQVLVWMGCLAELGPQSAELQNHRIIKVGKDFQDHWVQPLTKHNHANYTRALRDMSSGFSNTSKDGDFTPSLSSPFQCLTTFPWINSS